MKVAPAAASARREQGRTGVARRAPHDRGEEFRAVALPHLDALYTVFGQVVAGMDVVDRLQQWDTITSIRVWDGVTWIGQQ